MKRTLSKAPEPVAKPAPGSSDALCKRLAEEYPAQFAKWLFGVEGRVTVEKTEISRQPIRADSVIFSRDENEILHVEFQTSLTSDIPLALRILDYYVALKRQNPSRRVRQALLVLKKTSREVPDRYEDELTIHRYSVVKLWEQDPNELLKYEGLLPLATLCRAESGEELLSEVARRIDRIKSRSKRNDALNWSRMLAGLRYDKTLIGRILKESDMLEESVIYQEIFQKGEQRGLQRGVKQGVKQGAEQEARRVATRMLDRRFGKLSAAAQRQIAQLSVGLLEELCDALLDFRSKSDLSRWLNEHSSVSQSGT